MDLRNDPDVDIIQNEIGDCIVCGLENTDLFVCQMIVEDAEVYNSKIEETGRGGRIAALVAACAGCVSRGFHVNAEIVQDFPVEAGREPAAV